MKKIIPRHASILTLRRIMTKLRNGSKGIRKITSCESRSKVEDGLAFLLSLNVVEKVNEGKFVVYGLKKQNDRNIMKTFIQELYFGNYGLEDLKLLHQMKRKYLIEQLEKMNYRMHLIFAKYIESSPIMFGTGKYNLTDEEKTKIEEDVMNEKT